MVGGRLMINCGGNVVKVTDNGICSEVSSTDSFLPRNSVIQALSEAFPKQVRNSTKFYFYFLVRFVLFIGVEL